MLYVVGLGLGDEKDVTLKGKEAIEQSARVYLEHYTSILGASKERLVSLLNTCSHTFELKEHEGEVVQWVRC